jgi:NADPH-dependent ferric siderophore reductase
MELSFSKQIRKKALSIIDDRFFKHGVVLEVRKWPGSPMLEVDLHLPEAEMQFWIEVPYIKFCVGGFSFRDYTPFAWDVQTATCSLLIDTAHQGPGSKWAKELRAGDKVQYLKADSSRQLPHATNLIVGLGDNTSVAHLLALLQLTTPHIRFEGALVTDSPRTKALLKEYFGQPLISHTNEAALMDWLSDQVYCNEHTSFYLTGNEQLVIRLRKTLKSLGHSNIRAKSFWS